MTAAVPDGRRELAAGVDTELNNPLVQCCCRCSCLVLYCCCFIRRSSANYMYIKFIIYTQSNRHIFGEPRKCIRVASHCGQIVARPRRTRSGANFYHFTKCTKKRQARTMTLWSEKRYVRTYVPNPCVCAAAAAVGRWPHIVGGIICSLTLWRGRSMQINLHSVLFLGFWYGAPGHDLVAVTATATTRQTEQVYVTT